jgi:hypothetical protein
VRALQSLQRKDKESHLREKVEEVKRGLPSKTRKAAELATEKGASSWLTVLPLKEMNFTLNKREFKDAIHLRSDLTSTCTCGDAYTIDHAMVCRVHYSKT